MNNKICILVIMDAVLMTIKDVLVHPIGAVIQMVEKRLALVVNLTLTLLGLIRILLVQPVKRDGTRVRKRPLVAVLD